MLRIHIHQQTAQHQLYMDPNKSFFPPRGNASFLKGNESILPSITHSLYSPPAHKYFIFTHTSDSNLFKNVSDSRLCAGLCVSSTVCIFHISYSIKMAGKERVALQRTRWIMKEFLIY